MDICGLSELTSTLTPIIVHSNKNGKDESEPHGNLDVKKSDSESQGQIKHSLEDQQRHLQELKESMGKMKEEINNQTNQITQTLTSLFTMHQKEMVKYMDKHFEYMQTQFNAALSWRLKSHHEDLLKDLFPVFSPISEAIVHVQEELTNCKSALHALSEEVTAAKVSTTFGQAGVQTHSEVFESERPLSLPLRPRLQSTIQTGMPHVHFGSPEGSTIQCESKSRFVGKSPVKLQFPTFGKMDDISDPLQYLEKCEDFLALNPLADEELIATLRNVLHGTARDWWDVARHKIHTWKEFKKQFCAAFLSEDYEDELVERIRTRIQREGESIRDFAYMYQSLCKRWKPNIEEEEVIKLILKNINPQLASQLRGSRLSSVDGLVRLGQQLEKDRENQLQYGQRKNLFKKPSKPVSAETVAPSFNRENSARQSQPSQNRPPPAFCWRCKGNHPPASCPQLNSNRAASSPRPQQQQIATTPPARESNATLGSLT